MKATNPNYTYYKDAKDEFRWRYTSSNGNIIAQSSEGYKNKADCLSAIALMQGSSEDPVFDEDADEDANEDGKKLTTGS